MFIIDNDEKYKGFNQGLFDNIEKRLIETKYCINLYQGYISVSEGMNRTLLIDIPCTMLNYRDFRNVLEIYYPQPECEEFPELYAILMKEVSRKERIKKIMKKLY